MTQDISTSLLPVTLLTGFLGSGKTTLINYLLENNHNEKIMIIENEFGPVNLDSNLLTPNHDIQIVEMTNGCICCTVQGELTKALLLLKPLGLPIRHLLFKLFLLMS